MRPSVAFGPVPSHGWEAAGAAGIELLPLNRDPASGARTALIRSVPRSGVERKAQYHQCEEEFLCLAGRFTFDGMRWMRPLSYACYPPQVVHGARVSVPGGYLLYVRTSGSTQAYAVQRPVSDQAYHLEDSRVHEPVVLLEHPPAPLPGAPDTPGIRQRVLRVDPGTRASVTLWEFPGGARDLFHHLPAATPLEVLLVAVNAPVDEGPACDVLAYGCYGAEEVRPSYDATGSVIALVHAGPWH